MFSEDRPLSPRFVLAHVNNLDYDSAFVAEARGGQQFRGWDRSRYELIGIKDAIRALTYVFILANIDPKKSKPKPPQPSSTPDDASIKKQVKPGSFAFIARAKLAAARERKAMS